MLESVQSCSPERQTAGMPLSSEMTAHGHAHFLAESYGQDSRGRITHLNVFAPCGFNEEDQSVLASFRKMYGSGGHDLQLVLVGFGNPTDFGGMDLRNGLSPVLATSSVWTSRTPFVATDHLRIRRSETRSPKQYAKAVQRELDRIVRRELERRPWLADFARDVKIETTPGYCSLWNGNFVAEVSQAADKRWWSVFFRKWLRLSLNVSRKPVAGPIVLGYGSHFGLGLFEAE